MAEEMEDGEERSVVYVVHCRPRDLMTLWVSEAVEERARRMMSAPAGRGVS